MKTHRAWAWLAVTGLVLSGCPNKDGADGKADAKADRKADAKVDADAKADAKADTKADTKAEESGTDTGGGSDSGDSDSESESGGDAPAKPADDSLFAHLYWSFGDDTTSTVDITDAKAGTGKDDDLWKLMEECDECNGHDKLLDPKDERLPAEYKVGDKWIVVDGNGPHVGTVKGFGIEGGASEGHFYVLLIDFPGGKFPGGLSFPGETPPNPKAKLVEGPKKLPMGAKTKPIVKAIGTALETGLDAAGKKALKEHPLTDKAVSLYAPKMPGNATHIAAVSIDVPDPDGDEDMGGYIAGLFLVRDDGTIEVLSGPSHGIDTVAVTHLVDLDGDGFEEIAYTESYYEGEYSYLVHWNGTKPTTRALGGDGA